MILVKVVLVVVFGSLPEQQFGYIVFYLISGGLSIAAMFHAFFFRTLRPPLIAAGALYLIVVSMVALQENSVRPTPDSAYIILAAVEIADSGIAQEDPRKGLAFPILIWPPITRAISPELVTLIFLLVGVLCIIHWNVLRVSEVTPFSVVLVFGLGAVLLSTPLIRIMASYVHGHALFALGLGLMTLAAIEWTRNLSGSNNALIVLSLGWSLASVTRYEGILMGGVIFLFLLSRQHLEAPTLRELLIISSPPMILALAWIMNTGAPSRQLGPLGLAALVAAGFVVLVLIQRIEQSIRRGTYLLLVASGLFWIVVRFDPSQVPGISGEMRNIVLGAGGWGFTLMAFIALSLTTLFSRWSRLVINSFKLLAGLVIIAIALKYTDTEGIGRPGFNSSLNRYWFHFIPLSFGLATTIVVKYGSSIQKSVVRTLRPLRPASYQ